jgi:hypothetical protein
MSARTFRRPIDRVTAGQFNGLLAQLPSRRISGSGRVHVSRTAMGQRVGLDESPTFAHPWLTTPRWNADLEQFTAQVAPGFINGEPPLVQPGHFYTPDGEDPAGDMTLLGEPEVLLNFRAIGHDGTSGESVPEFFATMGVGAQPQAVQPGETVNVTEQAPTAGNRLLRACDIVLVQPRAAMKADTAISGSLLDGWTLRQSITYMGATATAHVTAQARFTAPGTSYLPEDFDQAFVERNFDAIKIATVYLVSPPDAAAGSAIDASWQPFVKHTLFWNLTYATPRVSGSVAPEPLFFFIPTPAGVLVQPLVSALLSMSNDALAAVTAQLASQSNEGRFWSV